MQNTRTKREPSHRIELSDKKPLHKIRINSQGFLYIARKGTMKQQQCPRYEGVRPCGDWCPMFGVPCVSKMIIDEKMDTVSKEYRLSLCETVLHIDELIDERYEG